VAEQPTSTSAVYSARPTVRVDGQEYATVSELIELMDLTESEGGMSALELRLTNRATDDDWHSAEAFADDSVLRLGAKLSVYAGDESAPVEIFQGLVTGLETEIPADGAPTMVVLAEDAFQRARLTRRTKVWDHATVAKVARQLAGQLGLTPSVSGLDADIGTQVQLNESDLAFLRRLMARHDGELQVIGGELHARPRRDVQRGTLTLAIHSQLRRARLLADLAHQATTVTVTGWDAAQGQRVSGTSTGANLGPGRGRTGAEVLQAEVGAQARHVGHLAVSTSDEAQAVADAAFDGAARRFCVVEGTAEGNAALRVGTSVTLAGVGPRFENTYYVTHARHRYDLARGYETDFTGECAYVGGAR
jgi:Bacteriophage probable baseplate hub protein